MNTQTLSKILSSKLLNPSGKVALIHLCVKAETTSKATRIVPQDLRNELGQSHSTVRTALRRLKELGAIEVEDNEASYLYPRYEIKNLDEVFS